MNRIFYSVFVVFLILTGTHAQAKKLKAMLSYASFYAPSTGPYIETYLSVVGNSVVYVKNAEGKYQGSIQVSLIFKKNDEIKYADKYNLLSQEIEDTTQVNFNFLDQQRIPLLNGDYTFELTISDRNAMDAPFNSSQLISINFPNDKVNISGIELVDAISKTDKNNRLTKNGFDLVPYVNNYYGPEVNALKFYAEIYNLPLVMQETPFLLSYYIEDYETKLTLEKYKVFSKQAPKEVNVVISQFNIQSLPSGNYNLVVEARNSKNELMIYKELFFQRNNGIRQDPMNDMLNADISNTFVAGLTDSVRLRECIYSFRPIANAYENTYQDIDLTKADLPSMQRYVYRFWKSRDSENPEAAFRKYMEMVEEVNASYKTPIYKGYETDRGRVYLQYGPPNEIIKEDREPSSYPYEIWHYYKIKSQTNKRFIFYNRDLVSNDYKLLHSDMQGEVYEPSWQEILHHGNARINKEDYPNKNHNFGERSQDSYGNTIKGSDFPH